MRKLLGVMLLASFGGLCATAANAGSATGTFGVNTNVNGSCTVGGTTIAFTGYDGTTDVTSDGTITANCTNGTAYSISLNAGAQTAAGATTAVRKMIQGSGTSAKYLNYTLAQADGTTNWGTSAGQTVAGTGAGTNQNFTVKGKITSGQTAYAGSYSDTITATITF